MAQPTPTNSDQAGQFLQLFQFKGMNVLAPRFAIADGEFSYLENLLPVTTSTANALAGGAPSSSALFVAPPPAPNLPALPAGQKVSRMWHKAVGSGGGNSATNWLIVHTLQGNLYAYNLDTTPVAAPVKINGSVMFSLPDMVTWQGTQLLVADSGAGYYSFALTGPSNNLTWSAGVQQAAPGVLAPVISLIAVAFGRVWILGNTQTVIVSAPGSYTDFTAINSAFNFTISDDSLRKAITRMRMCGDYLYLIGDGAVYAVGNVQATGAYQLTPVDESVGTQFYGAVDNITGTLVVATCHGVQAIGGLSPAQPITPQLAPFYTQLDLLTQPLVVTLGLINHLQVLLVLAKYNDPTQGPRSIFLALWNGLCCILSQGTSLTYACTVEIVDREDGHCEFNTYATDGTNIFKCFDDEPQQSGVAGLAFKGVSKLYDMQMPAFTKTVAKAGTVCFCTSPFGTLTTQLDTELLSSSTAQFNLPAIPWTGAGGVPVTWTGAGGVPVNWVGAGIVFTQYSPSLSGHYIGFTISGTTPGLSLAALLAEYQMGAPWV